MQYPVKKGSVVGAFVKVSLFQPPLLVIGQSSNGGVCKLLSGVNENTNNLTCTANNYVTDQIVHIEAIVGKLIVIIIKMPLLLTYSIDTIDCGDLPSLRDGYIVNDSYHGTYYGAVVHYYCKHGHIMNGNTTRTCLATGYWSNAEPTCTKVKCSKISNPDNGHARGDNRFGSTVYFTCDNNYILVGPSNVTCQANGEWTAPSSVCIQHTCRYPGDVINGFANSTDYTESSVIHYQCYNGYILSGLSTIICNSNGKWSNSLPVCLPINCSDPGIPENGQRFHTNFLFGSIVKFSCNNGYIIVGDDTIVCSENGHWNTTIPTCLSDETSWMTSTSTRTVIKTNVISLITTAKIRPTNSIFTFKITSAILTTWISPNKTRLTEFESNLLSTSPADNTVVPIIAVITTVTILLTLLLSFVGLFILMCVFIRRKRKRTQNVTSKILISEIFNDMFFILGYDIVVSNLGNNPSTNRPIINIKPYATTVSTDT